MQKYEGFRKAGIFTLSTGNDVPGELSLKGEATSLDLYSNTFFSTNGSKDIFGVFHDRLKVSLINCVTMSGPGRGTRGDEQYHFASLFPHLAVFGDQHISSADRTIREVRFAVDDAPALFYDFDAFGKVIDALPHMQRIADAKEAGREIQIGEYPHLFYFTGKQEIFCVGTVIGQVSATHGISYRLPGPEGIYVDNTIWINVAFDSEKTVDEALKSVHDILKFLEIIAGRPQNISKLAFIPMSAGDYPIILDVYWCLPPQRKHDDHNRDGKSHKPHPAAMLIQAAMKPDEFTGVLRRWLERHDSWENARARFSTAFAYQHSFNIDRLVGAANMFDILPSAACPATVLLDPDLVQARDNARKAFQVLRASPERDSVLGALGRIGKATLKRKVRSRAKLITNVVGGKFPEFELVLDHAVDCRNYYVHGSIAKIDYNKHFNLVAFFTDTLEFVFAASDLVESGWDITAWIEQGFMHPHPFGRYYVDYARQLNELKKLL